MKIIRSIRQIQKVTRRLASEGKIIGLVPTMGYLHEGHLSLIRKARRLSDVVITTIFVNPTQFAPNEDLDKYPRDEKGDVEKIKMAGGDMVFIPKTADIYPESYQTFVDVEQITKNLEGAVRPAHFRGVTTIVAKLLNMTRPDIAVFGLKDYQQAMVIKAMIKDLNYPIKIVVMPAVREKDGLAMSSRNRYFSPEQRAEAVCLYKALKTARDMVRNNGINEVSRLRTAMTKVIKKICPVASIDYIAFTDYESLNPMKKIEGNCICSLAVRLYGVRLIDNMML